MLSDREIRAAKPREKLYRLSDGGGSSWKSRRLARSSGACVTASLAKRRCSRLASTPTCADPTQGVAQSRHGRPYGRDVVSLWRKRFFHERIQGLEERPRPGRPRVFPPRAGRADQGAGL